MGSQPPLIIYDDRVPALGVLTDLRPVFEVRTGARRTWERIADAVGRPIAGALCPADVAALAPDLARVMAGPPADAAHVLVVNGRCVLPPQGLVGLAPGEALAETGSGETVAACVSAREAHALAAGGRLPAGCRTRETGAPCLLRQPWDVVRFRDAAIAQDLAALVARGGWSRPGPQAAVMGGPALVHPTATIGPLVVLDATAGPIVIDEHAVVRPGCTIVGPASIGRHCTVLDRAFIKANTALGPHCKVAGEVGGTIVQGCSNKAHDGHLGDAWLGEWVNLGAGTTNSNLLNTYAEVSAQAEPGATRVRTGLTFLGCILGDHVKTAICTRLMTGTVVGTGAMIASTAPPPTAVGRFAWITDAGERVYRLDRFVETAREMMARRKTEPSAALLERLGALHAAAAARAAVGP